MATFNNTIDEAGYGNYGAGGGGMFGGGGVVWLLFALVVFWLIFERRDGKGHGDGHGYAHGVRPVFPDESNYEQERNIDKKLCVLERDILADGQATRALIENNKIQDLRDKIMERDMALATLKNEMFTAAQIGTVRAENQSIMRELERIPKAMQPWATTVIPCNTTTVTGCGPRRGPCDGFSDAA